MHTDMLCAQMRQLQGSVKNRRKWCLALCRLSACLFAHVLAGLAVTHVTTNPENEMLAVLCRLVCTAFPSQFKVPNLSGLLCVGANKICLSSMADFRHMPARCHRLAMNSFCPQLYMAAVYVTYHRHMTFCLSCCAVASAL